MSGTRFKLAAMDFGGEKYIVVFFNGSARVLLYDEENDEFFMVSPREFLKLKGVGFEDEEDG